MTPKQKNRLWRVMLLTAAFAVLTVEYVTIFDRHGLGLPCPLLLLTGLQCPACGLTRAAAALLHGDFAAAFGHHVLWPLWAGYILWVAVADATVYVRQGKVQFLPGKPWVHGGVLALAVGYGILRNCI